MVKFPVYSLPWYRDFFPQNIMKLQYFLHCCIKALDLTCHHLATIDEQKTLPKTCGGKETNLY